MEMRRGTLMERKLWVSEDRGDEGRKESEIKLKDLG